MEEWYYRSIPNENTSEDDDDSNEEKYKIQYKCLKRKLKNLIYENESFQEALRSAQDRLLTVTRDRSFLLDRLLQHEKVELSSSDSEETESSDDPDVVRVDVKRRKVDHPTVNIGNGMSSSSSNKAYYSHKKKRTTPLKQSRQLQIQSPVQLQSLNSISANIISDGHMTPEEVERHLQSRQTYMELVPEKAPATVPTEMFSNDPSLDSESNDIVELETSPSNIGEDISIDMITE